MLLYLLAEDGVPRVDFALVSEELLVNLLLYGWVGVLAEKEVVGTTIPGAALEELLPVLLVLVTTGDS